MVEEEGNFAVMLAKKWDERVDPTGWLISEKLDGVRAYWTGTQLLSRNGKPFTYPPSFVVNFPKCELDGEMWLGRGQFQKTTSIVMARTNMSSSWHLIKYCIFEAPSLSKPNLLDRLALIKAWFKKYPNENVIILPQVVCKGRDHMFQMLDKIKQLDGEGLMLRDPESPYERRRSSYLLKVKTLDDSEAVIIGYTAGQGKYSEAVGAFKMQLPNGKTFKLAGMDDHLRFNPPPIGTVVTFTHQGLSTEGIPRFPQFLRIRTDIEPSEKKQGTSAGLDRFLKKDRK